MFEARLTSVQTLGEISNVFTARSKITEALHIFAFPIDIRNDIPVRLSNV